MKVLRSLVAAAALVALVAGCGNDDDGGSSTAAVFDGDERVVTLLDAADETILGQPLVYPDGEAEVSASVVTLQPGEETGAHVHDAPLLGVVVDGTLTVDYGADGERTYGPGDTFLEAVGVGHNGRNDGDEPVTILVVNIGAAGVENTVAEE